MKKRFKKILALTFCFGTSLAFAIDSSYFTKLASSRDVSFSNQECDQNQLLSMTGHLELEEKAFVFQDENQNFSSPQNKSGAKSRKRSGSTIKKLNVYGEPIPLDTLFYRSLLTDSQKQLYDAVYNAVQNMESFVSFSDAFSVSDYREVIKMVVYDNPEFFWWEREATVFSYGIMFTYLFSKEEMQFVLRDFNSKAFPVLYYASLLETDLEKMRYVHDWICGTSYYNYDAVEKNQSGGHNQTAYSTLVLNTTVCAGYAKAYAYFLQQLGIPCAYIHSDNHAWNIIKYNNDYYQTDVCWDDGIWGSKSSYYMLSDTEMASVESHKPISYSAKVASRYRTRRDIPNDVSYSYKLYYNYKELDNFLLDIEAPQFINFGKAKSGGKKDFYGYDSTSIKFNAYISDGRGNVLEELSPNQRIKIHVKSDKNCFINILMVDAEGHKEWLEIKNNQLKSEQEKIFPDMKGYELVVNGDLFGSEKLVIYASSNESSLPGNIPCNDFRMEDLYFIMREQRAKINTSSGSMGSTEIKYQIKKS